MRRYKTTLHIMNVQKVTNKCNNAEYEGRLIIFTKIMLFHLLLIKCY